MRCTVVPFPHTEADSYAIATAATSFATSFRIAFWRDDI